MYKSGLFNVRPLCFWALLVAVTLWCCSVGYWLAGLFVLLIVAVLVACQFIKKGNGVVKFFGNSKGFFITAFVLCLAVIFTYGITQVSYATVKSYAGMHELSGTVESYNLRSKDEGASYMTLSNAKFGGEAVNGRVIVFVNYNGQPHNVATGHYVKFNADLRACQAEPINVNSRVAYQTNVKIENITVGEQSYELKFIVWRYSSNMFETWMGYENAQFMQSMLFGDKSTMDGEVFANFKIAGLIHALAVSGMNVALIIGMLAFVFKLCHLRKKIQFPIIVVILIFYCYLCDWQFSIMRATIMFLIILALRTYLHKSDLLSCVCASAIITLVVFPFALWSWSFQLSYACMVGIALFNKPVVDFLNRFKFKNAPNFVDWFQNGIIACISMYLCATVATFPLLVQMFGVVPTYGLIANLLLLPLIVLAFQVECIALVTWLMQILLYPIDWVVTVVMWGVNLIASLPFAVINLSNGGIFNLFYFVGLLLFSRFIFLRGRYRYVAIGCCMAVYCVGFFVNM